MPTLPANPLPMSVPRPDPLHLAAPVLVTGAGGFIGRHVLARLAAAGVATRALLRSPPGLPLPQGIETVTGDLARSAVARDACAGMATVLHCAGYAHALGQAGQDAARHRHDTVLATQCLLGAARQHGVGRMVYLSSVKAIDASDAYGHAKRSAEDLLLAGAADGGPAVCVLRPALVYGPGQRGNLQRLAAAVAGRRCPPLPETGARRSLVHVDDLIDALLLVAREPRAAGQRLVVAHPQAHSARELYNALRVVLGRPPVRWAVPAAWLQRAAAAGSLLKRCGLPAPLDREMLARLLEAAEYDSAPLRRLGWQPRVDLLTGLASACGLTHGTQP